jgi:UDP-glucose 4-epimerase
MLDIVDAKAFDRGQPDTRGESRNISSRSIAVVGATCPLGRHLVEALVASGHSVLALSRTMQKVPLAWRANPRVLNTVFDLRDPAGLVAALRNSTHVIWLAHAPELLSPSTGHDPNVVALNSVCNARAQSPRKIVLVSSGGSVYGDPISLPVVEECLRNPKSAYGLAKKNMEDALQAATETQNCLSGIVLRPGNIYGKYYLNSGAKGCIGAFARALLAGQQITLLAGGRAVRDFIHADDVVNAIFAVIATDRSFAVWNVGSGIGTQVQKVLEMICSVLNRSPVGINGVPAPPTDVDGIILSTTKIRMECSWSPMVSLPTGLKDILLSRPSIPASVSQRCRTSVVAKERGTAVQPPLFA